MANYNLLKHHVLGGISVAWAIEIIDKFVKLRMVSLTMVVQPVNVRLHYILELLLEMTHASYVARHQNWNH